MVKRKGAEVQVDGNSLGLTWLELHFRETLQLLLWAGQRGLLVVDVNLNDFLARHLPRIGDIHRDCESIHIFERGRRKFRVAISECGVTEPITEGEEDREFPGMIVFIDNVDTFALTKFACVCAL